MKKIIKTFPYFIMAVIIVVSFFCGMGTKKRWKDDTKLRNSLSGSGFTVESSSAEEDISFLLPEEVSSFKRLCTTADVILRVKTASDFERTMYTQCTLTDVEVLDVYQGYVSDKIISVFEPTYVDEKFVMTIGSYQLMEDNKEYILFLKKIKCSLYNNRKYVYLPTTTSLSKYQCRSNSVTGEAYIRNGDDGLDFKRVCSYDMLTSDENLKKLYHYYGKQIQILISEENK